MRFSQAEWADSVLDNEFRSGEFKLILPYRLPVVLGHDVAGVVVKVGPKVSRFKLGDEVYSRPDDFRIGAFAEFISIEEDSLAIKPKTSSRLEEKSFPSPVRQIRHLQSK
jgi:alcohol dehydrogenase